MYRCLRNFEELIVKVFKKLKKKKKSYSLKRGPNTLSSEIY